MLAIRVGDVLAVYFILGDELALCDRLVFGDMFGFALGDEFVISGSVSALTNSSSCLKCGVEVKVDSVSAAVAEVLASVITADVAAVVVAAKAGTGDLPRGDR